MNDQDMEFLLRRWIPDLNKGRLIADHFFRKKWYLDRIFQLGVVHAKSEVGMKRCKYGTNLYNYYEKTMNEIHAVKEALCAEVQLIEFSK